MFQSFNLDISTLCEVMLQTEQLYQSQDNKGVREKGKCLHLSLGQNFWICACGPGLTWTEIERYQSCNRNIDARQREIYSVVLSKYI